MSNQTNSKNASAATTAQKINLKRGMRVMVYNGPSDKTGDVVIASLLSDNKVQHGNSFHMEDGTVRTLHCWFVKFDDGCKGDRWVCPLDVVEAAPSRRSAKI